MNKDSFDRIPAPLPPSEPKPRQRRKVSRKGAKNWVGVVMSGSWQKEAKALADVYGIPFPSFLRYAIMHFEKHVEGIVGMSQKQAVAMPRRERREFAARQRAIWRCCRFVSEEILQGN